MKITDMPVPFVSFRVNAMQVSVSNMETVARWCKGAIRGTSLPIEERIVQIQSPEGERDAAVGDCIIKFPNGAFRVLSNSEFEAAFRPFFAAHANPGAAAERMPSTPMGRMLFAANQPAANRPA